MLYTKYFVNKPKKIPAFLSLIVLIVVTIFTVKIFSLPVVPSKASKQIIKQLKTTNITDKEADIFWETADKDSYWIAYGKDEGRLNKISFDERDLTEKKGKFFFHLAKVKNLQENTNYYFKISSSKQVIDNNGKAFSFKTKKFIKSSPPSKLVYGKIIKKNGKGLENSIVLLKMPDSSYFSTITKSIGEWLIVLGPLDKPINDYQKVTLSFFSEDKQITTVTAVIGNLSPLSSSIIIGENYDLIKENPQVLSAQDKKTFSIKKEQIEIIFPKKGMIVPRGKPLLKGLALPGKEVVVLVHSDASYSFRVKADKDGVWLVNLPESLNPGNHKVIIITKDASGKEIRKENNFVIAKSGEQVLGEATGSATLTATPQATPTLRPTVFYPSFSPTKKTLKKAGSSMVNLSMASVLLIGVGVALMLAF